MHERAIYENFENFSSEMYIEEIARLEHSLIPMPEKTELKIPFYILKNNFPGGTRVAVITGVENTHELKGSLGIKDVCNVTAGGDCITLKPHGSKSTIRLYHPDNIKAIREALELNTLFIIKDEKIHAKVKEYKNGSYIWWDGWMPSLKETCVGMPRPLLLTEEPTTIEIDSTKEHEAIHHHTLNKWISRSLMAAIILFIGYRLKDKIYHGALRYI